VNTQLIQMQEQVILQI